MGKGRGKGRSNIEGLDPESPKDPRGMPAPRPYHRGTPAERRKNVSERHGVGGVHASAIRVLREAAAGQNCAGQKSQKRLGAQVGAHEGPGGLSTGEKRALEEAAKQKAATIEIERKRVESIKRKQQQEIARSARIIEKEKVLTNMQEHLKHIQELEAERAAKHQEKRDKAKQKAPVRVDIHSIAPGSAEISRGAVLSRRKGPVLQ